MTWPSWVAGPLVLLGLMYLVAKPFGVVDEWLFYVYSLVLAVLLALYMRWRYEVSVVERSEGWVIVRCGLRRSRVRKPMSDQALGEE